MKNNRLLMAKEIERICRDQGCTCTILGKGKTANAISSWLKSNTKIEDFSYIVEDTYAGEDDDTLSNFLNNSISGEKLIVYGFSNYDKAVLLDKSVFLKKGIKTFFIPFPFSYNETETYIDEDFYLNHSKQFADTKKLLEADSRELFEVYINSQITGDLNILEKYSESVQLQYFKSDCIPTEKTTFIDVGAFTGDTMPYAFNTLDISRYIALEPEHDNAAKIREQIQERAEKNIELIEAGAWDSNTTLSFEAAGSSSEVSENGDQTIKVITLDSLLPKLSKEESVFIKMDIEGAEMKALLGAEKMIKKHIPYLAISVYHKVDDLITIPQYIEKSLPGVYEYRLGYYGNNYRELVLYATPKKAL